MLRSTFRLGGLARSLSRQVGSRAVTAALSSPNPLAAHRHLSSSFPPPDAIPRAGDGSEAKPISQPTQEEAKNAASSGDYTELTAKLLEDSLEIKDPRMIFETAWSAIEAKYGATPVLPPEVIWLGGAPGSGKGTHSRFLEDLWDLSPSLIISDLFKTHPELTSTLDTAGLVSDSLVVQLLIEELCQQGNLGSKGIIVDGFPRTTTQVSVAKLLKNKMVQVHRERTRALVGLQQPENLVSPRTVFRSLVLFCDEETSVDRQLSRGKAAIEQGERARATDTDERAARARYKVFHDHYQTLVSLQSIIPFSLVDASQEISGVQADLAEELRAQASNEVNRSTYDLLQFIPSPDELVSDARLSTVSRIEGLAERDAPLLSSAINFVNTTIVPQLRLHALAGVAEVTTADPRVAGNLEMTRALVDVLNYMGYRAHAHEVTHTTTGNVGFSQVSFEVQWKRPTLGGNLHIRSSEDRK